RKELWEDEALAASEEYSSADGGVGASAVTGDPGAESWKTTGVQAGQEVGLMTIRKPSECVRVFEMMLQLIVARGVLFGRTDSLHSTTSLYQENLPLMAATSFGMLDDPKRPPSRLSKVKGGGVRGGAGGESAAPGVNIAAVAGIGPPASSITEASDTSSKTRISTAL
ncbi:hypothetical protein Gpo141_00012739, partial [Globisporangium polare]